MISLGNLQSIRGRLIESAQRLDKIGVPAADKEAKQIGGLICLVDNEIELREEYNSIIRMASNPGQF